MTWTKKLLNVINVAIERLFNSLLVLIVFNSLTATKFVFEIGCFEKIMNRTNKVRIL